MSSSHETTAGAEDTPGTDAAGESQPNPPPPPATSAADNLSQKLEKMNISSSFSIWPPTQRTRDAVINRLIETLSSPSVLSKRYGTMPHDEASSTAKAIELEAYNSAAASAGGDAAAAASVDEGIEILQVYSKEISKRMLDAVKSRAASAEASQATEDATAAPAAVTSEEVSSVDN